MDDLFNQALKESYWFVIIGALAAVAFAPSFLKSKCPKCGKRKLVSVIPDDQTVARLKAENEHQFLTFYFCQACTCKFYRQRTGPLQDADDPHWDSVFADAVQ